MRDTMMLRDRIQAAVFCASIVLPLSVEQDALAEPAKATLETASPTGENRTPEDKKTDTKVPPDGESKGAPQREPAAKKTANNGFYSIPRLQNTIIFCRPVKAAKKFATADSSIENDCPVDLEKNSDAYVADNMQDRQKHVLVYEFLALETRRVRKSDKKYQDACCYQWIDANAAPVRRNRGGRPFVDGAQAIVAGVRSGGGWKRDSRKLGLHLPLVEQERLAQAWLADALAEHASVASFARTTLELLAVGAPSALVRDSQRASLDEVRHAERCFELASAYGGSPLEPGPLLPLGPREADLDRLAMDTFMEGCVEETVAALHAQRASERGPAPVAKVWKMLAADEARHAALAWRTLSWLIGCRGAPLCHRLGELAARQQPAPTVRARAEDEIALEGRLSERELLTARAEAWREIILPTLKRLSEGSR